MKTTNEKTVLLRARVPARRLQNAERVLGKLGMKPSDAINIFIAQVELHQGLPFNVNLQSGPLLSAEAQAAEWNEAFGEY